MLLVGVGGSGRQSLSRLAAYILDYKVFQIEVTRHYRLQEFREDLQKLYYQAGVENNPSVFLFTDTQVVEESFLEDINNIFSSGEVPNLYKPDEFEEVSIADICVLCVVASRHMMHFNLMLYIPGATSSGSLCQEGRHP